MKWLNKKPSRSADTEDVNPMHYIGNLSDVMLVLAVGMMLALVIAWNVDIVNGTPAEQSMDPARMEQVSEQLEPLHEADASDDSAVSLEDFGLTQYGMVYVDEDGNYYVLEAQEDGQ